MTTGSRRMAFVHIPRTGGTSLGRIMRHIYGAQNIAEFYGDAEENVVNNKIERFRSAGLEKQSLPDVLIGHFVFEFDELSAHYAYTTMLRRPLDRMISYYFYALRDRNNYFHSYIVQRRLSLDAFLLSDLSLDFDNYQVRAISGASFESHRERVDEEHLNKAKSNLADRFRCFGLTERFPESVDAFAAAFGWNIEILPRDNMNSYPGEVSVSQEAVAHVEASNRFDQQLYDFGSALFEERLQQALQVHR